MIYEINCVCKQCGDSFIYNVSYKENYKRKFCPKCKNARAKMGRYDVELPPAKTIKKTTFKEGCMQWDESNVMGY